MNDMQRKPLVAEGHGLLETWVNLSAGVAERAVHGSFGWARDLTNESTSVVDATLGWVDSVSHSAIKVLRLGVCHGGQLCHDVIDFGEHGSMQTIRVLGAAGRDATALVSSTAVGLTRDPRQVSAALS
jgi:hypothetical protein